MPARSAPRGRDTRGWFLASDGADAADLFGGMSVHREMKRSQRFVGLGGAVIGIGIGLRGRDTPDHRGRWDAGALRQGTVGRAGVITRGGAGRWVLERHRASSGR